MRTRHIDSANPGRSKFVFRSKPIPEAEMSNRLIRQMKFCDSLDTVFCINIKAEINLLLWFFFQLKFSVTVLNYETQLNLIPTSVLVRVSSNHSKVSGYLI